MSALLALLAGVLIVLAITALTGYFVAQEFAYVSVDRSKLGARAESGDDAAQRALDITRRTSFLLSGAQLGITVTGLLVGYVAEPLIGESLRDILGLTGVPAGIGLVIGSVVALVFSTVVQMVFGELFPKNYAIARADAVAERLSRSSSIYLKVFGPVIWVFDKASEGLLKIFGIEPVHDVEHAATARDLEHVVEESRESGELSPELSTLLDRVLDFPTRTVEHAMIPRSRVDIVRDTTEVGAVRALMAEGHTRYPVLAEEDDDIVGVVHLVDLLDLDRDQAGAAASVARPPLVVSHLMSLPDALHELHDRREQLACVVDEYGGFSGILTIEDLAEEVVGEITDEHDPEDASYEPVEGDGIWVMDGDVHVDEVERALMVDLPRGEYETVAGLVIDHVGGLPEEGQVVEIDLPVDPDDLIDDDEPQRRFVRAEVLEVERFVPTRVRLTMPDPEVDSLAGVESGADGPDGAGDSDREVSGATVTEVGEPHGGVPGGPREPALADEDGAVRGGNGGAHSAVRPDRGGLGRRHKDVRDDEQGERR